MPQDDAAHNIAIDAAAAATADAASAKRARRIVKTMETVVAQQQCLPPPGEALPTQPLACETCGETFARKKALVRHQRERRCFWRERARAAYQQAVANSHFADSLDEYVANVLARPAPTDSLPPQGATSGHVCSSCSKQLGSRQALAKHIRLRRCVDHRTAAGNRAILAGRTSVD